MRRHYDDRAVETPWQRWYVARFGQFLAAKWVAQRRAGGVDDCGWDEFDVAVADEDFPAGVVHVPMMRFAQQDAVFDAGFTIVDPVSTVVRLTHSRWPIAAGESTSAVSCDERAADG